MHFYFLDILQFLNRIDHDLFRIINVTLSSSLLDGIMLLLRDPLTWIPLYAFNLFWIIRYQRRFAWQWILMSLIVFAITDFTSASILKNLFLRPRPCFDESLQPVLRSLIGCGGKYGMPSSHASNHFGLATFWYFTVKWMSRRRWWWLWVWAILVCYAQIYVGKHFPGDILVGMVLGLSVGFLIAVMFRKWLLKKSL